MGKQRSKADIPVNVSAYSLRDVNETLVENRLRDSGFKNVPKSTVQSIVARGGIASKDRKTGESINIPVASLPTQKTYETIKGDIESASELFFQGLTDIPVSVSAGIQQMLAGTDKQKLDAIRKWQDDNTNQLSFAAKRMLENEEMSIEKFMFTAGNTVGQIVGSMATAAAGTAIGATAGTAVGGPVGTVGGAIGGFLGGMAVNMPFMYNSLLNSARDAGISDADAVGYAYGAGIGLAALEAVPLSKIAGWTAKSVAPSLTKSVLSKMTTKYGAKSANELIERIGADKFNKEVAVGVYKAARNGIADRVIGRAGAVGMGALAEGGQEITEFYLEKLAQATYDSTRGEGKQAGKGAFGTQFTQEEFFGKKARDEAFWNGVFGAVGGGFAGTVQAVSSPLYKTGVYDTIDTFVKRGKTVDEAVAALNGIIDRRIGEGELSQDIADTAKSAIQNVAQSYNKIGGKFDEPEFRYVVYERISKKDDLVKELGALESKKAEIQGIIAQNQGDADIYTVDMMEIDKLIDQKQRQLDFTSTWLKDYTQKYYDNKKAKNTARGQFIDDSINDFIVRTDSFEKKKQTPYEFAKEANDAYNAGMKEIDLQYDSQVKSMDITSLNENVNQDFDEIDTIKTKVRTNPSSSENPEFADVILATDEDGNIAVRRESIIDGQSKVDYIPIANTPQYEPVVARAKSYFENRDSFEGIASKLVLGQELTADEAELYEDFADNIDGIKTEMQQRVGGKAKDALLKMNAKPIMEALQNMAPTVQRYQERISEIDETLAKNESIPASNQDLDSTKVNEKLSASEVAKLMQTKQDLLDAISKYNNELQRVTEMNPDDSSLDELDVKELAIYQAKMAEVDVLFNEMVERFYKNSSSNLKKFYEKNDEFDFLENMEEYAKSVAAQKRLFKSSYDKNLASKIGEIVTKAKILEAKMQENRAGIEAAKQKQEEAKAAAEQIKIEKQKAKEAEKILKEAKAKLEQEKKKGAPKTKKGEPKKEEVPQEQGVQEEVTETVTELEQVVKEAGDIIIEAANNIEQIRGGLTNEQQLPTDSAENEGGVQSLQTPTTPVSGASETTLQKNVTQGESTPKGEGTTTMATDATESIVPSGSNDTTSTQGGSTQTQLPNVSGDVRLRTVNDVTGEDISQFLNGKPANHILNSDGTFSMPIETEDLDDDLRSSFFLARITPKPTKGKDKPSEAQWGLVHKTTGVVLDKGTKSSLKKKINTDKKTAPRESPNASKDLSIRRYIEKKIDRANRELKERIIELENAKLSQGQQEKIKSQPEQQVKPAEKTQEEKVGFASLISGYREGIKLGDVLSIISAPPKSLLDKVKPTNKQEIYYLKEQGLGIVYSPAEVLFIKEINEGDFVVGEMAIELMSGEDIKTLTNLIGDVANYEKLLFEYSFLNKNKGKFTTNENLPEWALGFAQDLHDRFTPKSSLHIISKDSIGNMSLSQVREMGLSSVVPVLNNISKATHFSDFDKGVNVIVMGVSERSKLSWLEIFSHEFGHHIQESLFYSAPKTVQDAIIADYNKWLNKNKKNELKMISSLFGSWMPKDIGEFSVNIDKWNSKTKEEKEFYLSYISQFDEWFAQNTSQYVVTNEKSSDIVSKFFSDIADKIKALYDFITRNKYYSKPLNDFLDAIQESNIVRPIKETPEDKVNKQKFDELPEGENNLPSFDDIAVDDVEGLISKKQELLKKNLSPEDRELIDGQISQLYIELDNLNTQNGEIVTDTKPSPSPLKAYNKGTDNPGVPISLKLDQAANVDTLKERLGKDADKYFNKNTANVVISDLKSSTGGNVSFVFYGDLKDVTTSIGASKKLFASRKDQLVPKKISMNADEFASTLKANDSALENLSNLKKLGIYKEGPVDAGVKESPVENTRVNAVTIKADTTINILYEEDGVPLSKRLNAGKKDFDMWDDRDDSIVVSSRRFKAKSITAITNATGKVLYQRGATTQTQEQTTPEQQEVQSTQKAQPVQQEQESFVLDDAGNKRDGYRLFIVTPSLKLGGAGRGVTVEYMYNENIKKQEVRPQHSSISIDNSNNTDGVLNYLVDSNVKQSDIISITDNYTGIRYNMDGTTVMPQLKNPVTIPAGTKVVVTYYNIIRDADKEVELRTILDKDLTLSDDKRGPFMLGNRVIFSEEVISVEANTKGKGASKDAKTYYERGSTLAQQEAQPTQQGSPDIQNQLLQIKRNGSMTFDSGSQKFFNRFAAGVERIFPGVSIGVLSEQDWIDSGLSPSSRGAFNRKTGQVMLRESMYDGSTFVHEVGHAIMKIIGDVDTNLYNAMLDAVEGTKYEAYVRDNYPNLTTREEILSEAMGYAIQDKGVKMQSRPMAAFRDMMTKAFNAIKKFMGYRTNKDIGDMTLDDFTSEVAGIMFGIKDADMFLDEFDLTQNAELNNYFEAEGNTDESSIQYQYFKFQANQQQVAKGIMRGSEYATFSGRVSAGEATMQETIDTLKSIVDSPILESQMASALTTGSGKDKFDGYSFIKANLNDFATDYYNIVTNTDAKNLTPLQNSDIVELGNTMLETYADQHKRSHIEVVQDGKQVQVFVDPAKEASNVNKNVRSFFDAARAKGIMAKYTAKFLTGSMFSNLSNMDTVAQMLSGDNGIMKGIQDLRVQRNKDSARVYNGMRKAIYSTTEKLTQLAVGRGKASKKITGKLTEGSLTPLDEKVNISFHNNFTGEATLENADFTLKDLVSIYLTRQTQVDRIFENKNAKLFNELAKIRKEITKAKKVGNSTRVAKLQKEEQDIQLTLSQLKKNMDDSDVIYDPTAKDGAHLSKTYISGSGRTSVNRGITFTLDNKQKVNVLLTRDQMKVIDDMFEKGGKYEEDMKVMREFWGSQEVKNVFRESNEVNYRITGKRTAEIQGLYFPIKKAMSDTLRETEIDPNIKNLRFVLETTGLAGNVEGLDIFSIMNEYMEQSTEYIANAEYRDSLRTYRNALTADAKAKNALLGSNDAEIEEEFDEDGNPIPTTTTSNGYDMEVIDSINTALKGIDDMVKSLDSGLKSRRDANRELDKAGIPHRIYNLILSNFSKAVFSFNLGNLFKQSAGYLAGIGQGIVGDKYIYREVGYIGKIIPASMKTYITNDGKLFGKDFNGFFKVKAIEREMEYLEKHEYHFADILRRIQDESAYTGNIELDSLDFVLRKKGKLGDVYRAANKTIFKGLSAMRMNDAAVIIAFVRAARAEVTDLVRNGKLLDAENNPITDVESPKALRLIAEKASELVYRTNNMYMENDKTPLQRSNNILHKSIGLFSSQPQKISNLFAQRFMSAAQSDFKDEEKNKTMRSTMVWAMLAGATLQSSITIMYGILRNGYDEEREYELDFFYEFIRNFTGMFPSLSVEVLNGLLSALDNAPWTGDIASNPVFSLLENAIKATAALKESMDEDKPEFIRDRKYQEGVRQGADALAKIFGAPTVAVNFIVKQALLEDKK